MVSEKDTSAKNAEHVQKTRKSRRFPERSNRAGTKCHQLREGIWQNRCAGENRIIKTAWKIPPELSLSGLHSYYFFCPVQQQSVSSDRAFIVEKMMLLIRRHIKGMSI